jgi:hypothetical protein
LDHHEHPSIDDRLWRPDTVNGFAAIAPDAALRSTFGESVTGPVAAVVVRNWSALIGLMGAMLIYSARKPAVRPLALTMAGGSKAIFAPWRSRMVAAFLVTRQAPPRSLLAWVLVFPAYLVSIRRIATPDRNAEPIGTV